MGYNLNSAYGQLDAAAMVASHQGGKTLVVCPADSSANFQRLIPAFRPDQDGEVRFFSTIQAAVDMVEDMSSGSGDTIYIVPGEYDEAVTINRGIGPLTLVGLGGLGAAYIAPSTAGAKGLVCHSDDVTLINLGVAGDDTATSALSGSGSRFRAINCKIEGVDVSGSAVAWGPGTVAQEAAGTRGRAGDINFYNCELCWSVNGFEFITSDFGTPTQIYIENCRLHNISGTEFLGTPGAFGIGSVRNLMVKNSLLEAMEDGTNPSDYVNINTASDTGIFANNAIAIATNAVADIKVGAGIMWVANATEAGFSTARPA